ncbi:uncharacterized protein LOC135955403 [Calliphora vicina]|uniref:uncharacterized protein LOC135955403 n=1 Tax=Calliphora vicina TaxID=7373 RepID=UPI00325AA907
MSDAMDKFKLIAEIRKRRELWDFESEEHRNCLSLADVWKDLSVTMGSDVDKCKFIWMNLLKGYRSIVKRIDLYIKADKLKGSYDPNNDYSSKWVYLKSMEFMRNIPAGPSKHRYASDKLKLIAEIRKRPVLWDLQTKRNSRVLQQTWKQLSRIMGADVDDCKRKWKILRGIYRKEVMKLELRIVEDKSNGSYSPNNEYTSKWSFYEHMKFIDGIKNQRPLKSVNSYVSDNNQSPSNLSGQNSSENQDDIPTTSNGKCTKRSYDQANFFKSPVSDITDSNDMVHVTDADYNFLMSFLPQMKKINELENFQFRAQITDLMLDIVSESMAN